jgi:4-amino-4-deoxy-L-arabinose transferase-like glycosyltransferase
LFGGSTGPRLAAKRLEGELSEKTRSLLLQTALLAAALAARLLFLGHKSIWADEAYAAGLVDLPLREAMDLFSRGTPHPGGGLAVIWLSARLFGPAETGIRMLVALLTASATWPLFSFLSRRAGSRGAFWAAACWALCPWSVSLGQEAWVYGPMAALTLWAVHFADLAWRGSWRALAGFLAACAAGLWIQAMFLLSAAAGIALYFTLPREGRCSLRRVSASAAAVILAAVPVLIPMPAELAERSARMSRAGITGLDFARLLSRSPGVLARLLPGGLLPDSWNTILDTPKYLAVFAAGSLLQLWTLAAAFAGGGMKRSGKIWVAALLLVPLGLFLRDDPTVRQFPLGWLAAALCMAHASSRWRPTGPAAAAFCLLILAGYYGIDSFPYHRSDWRAAVQTVESSAGPGDAVVLLGAKSMAQAWDFYETDGLPRIAVDGGNPYLLDSESPAARDPLRVADSLLSEGGAVWLVMDHWAGPTLTELFPDGELMPPTAGSVMQVMRVGRPAQPQI